MMTGEQRETFNQWTADLPDDERTALLGAFESAQPDNEMVSLTWIADEALARLGVTPEAAARKIAAGWPWMPDWRGALS
ncbi:MAG: hypothetical protein M3Y22_05805 [Pseudomonadota bacterium]|nr:hypothetical protein [Pseudomonadota bacterium]